MDGSPLDRKVRPVLNGGSVLVLACIAINAAMCAVMVFTDDSLSFWIMLAATIVGGGAALSAIRGRGRKNIYVGIAGLLWILVPVASLAYQIYWASRI
jgi:hypothetical protein